MSMPEKKFRAGAVQATVWKNQSEKGDYMTVSFEKHYKKGEEWKTTNSLSVNDIPKAIVVLSRSFDYVALKE